LGNYIVDSLDFGLSLAFEILLRIGVIYIQGAIKSNFDPMPLPRRFWHVFHNERVK
jgi:hypothetical protein